jgi:hypothetical protein
MYRKKAGQWQQIGVDPATAVNWAQVTGGTVTEYTKPDGSVMEVHTFTASATPGLTVVQAGYARVLCVTSGSTNAGGGAGNGGSVSDGHHALPVGSLAVVIGAGGGVGAQSSLGSLVATRKGEIAVNANNINHGAGDGFPSAATTAGFTSDITGTAVAYGAIASTTPGSWHATGNTAYAGVVIVAVQKTPPTASGVVASGGTETTFTGDGTNGVLGQGYKVHKFTADSSLVVTAGGACEVLLISGGSAVWTAASYGGGGGTQWLGTMNLGPGTYPVDVGAGGVQSATYASTWGKPSSIAGKATTDAFPNAGTGGGPGGGMYTANIDGTSRTYCGGNSGTPSGTTIGDGGAGASPGNLGVVIVRYKI